MKKFLVSLLLIWLIISCKSNKSNIVIFHAGSLTIPLKQVKEAFEKRHAQSRVLLEGAGSRKCARKISELGKRCDIIFSADYSVIDALLIKKGFASWDILFTTNEMAIMYTSKSKYADEITKDNWPDILLRDDVKFSHSDPNMDPCGYRTLLVWQLAEKFYNKAELYKKLTDACPLKYIRPKETDLISLLELGELDYIFIYKSVCMQHNMKFVELPDNINLGKKEFDSFYSNASVELTGSKKGTIITKKGEPMIYGFSIPKTVKNTNGAIAFIQFLMSDEGKKIFKENGQEFLSPMQVTGDKKTIPGTIKNLL